MKGRLTAIAAVTLMVIGCGEGAKEAPAPAAEAGKDKAAAGAGEAAKPLAAAAADAPVKLSDLKPPRTEAPAAKVLIHEFSDFQCPFCGRVNPTIEKIKKTYGGDVQVAFLHNALPFHKEARGAAITAVAADLQGKFWEMHDKLFANMRALKADNLRKYAEELGLDMAKYDADIKDKALGAFVDRNRAISNALGATGTPAFFINGLVLKGAQPFEKFKEIIDKEVAAAQTAGKSGEAWLKERIKANNKDMAAYLFEGKEPPKIAPQKNQKKQRPPDRTVYKVDVEKNDPTLGPATAPVTIAVFSEFQCPFCKRVKPSLDAVKKEFGDKVRIVFKHNPLPFHKDAFPAAEAAQCANDQGKFWEMHDKLFENMRALKMDNLKAYASELGINMAKWQKCMDSGTHKAYIERQIELAGKVTARGTPNSFINGRKLTGAKPAEEFKSLVKEELAKAEKLAASKGIAADKLYAEIIKNGKVFEPLDAKVNNFDLSNTALKGGNAKAKIQIVEFSDFQCPFCSRVGKPLFDVVNHYGKDATVAFKHFPLNFHKQAFDAAMASECARDQGKFWEYHDALFAAQKELTQSKWDEYAEKVGLDMDKFKSCMTDKKHKGLVEAHMAEARKAGVRGTPTIFINGRKFTSASGYNLKAFTSVIDKHILKK